MTNTEKKSKMVSLFGEHIAEFPRDYPEWDGPPCLVYWADGAQWNSQLLFRESSVGYKFMGPHAPDSLPFAPKGQKGYTVIFLEDDE